MSDTFTIEIDGRACAANPGEMIIAVADRAGIPIPRFCYHPKLSIAANCRMCLVEAEQGGRAFPKPVPACATPVGDGMKVWTRSPKALEAQRGTMEFLLINHPLDCPICDQGGECELQDLSMGYGDDLSRFSERKRVVADEDFGPLIATDMTRCIHCTRCVRFGEEIAGVRELGVTSRGEQMRIGTYVAHTVAHELSGNVIDLCPVGALTSKPFRFKARAWELTAHDGIAPHDGVGANLSLHVRGGQVLRVVPRENEVVNETWIADRDRFGYEGLASPARLREPLIKRDGGWQAIDWQEALTFATNGLRAHGGDALGCLIGPGTTLEEQYLLQKLARALGCRNLDSRLRQQDFRADAVGPRWPWLGLPIAELERQQAILLIGCDPRAEQPLLAHRIRKAALRDAKVTTLNAYRLALHHPARQLLAAPSAGLREELRRLAAALVHPGGPASIHAALAAELVAAGKNARGILLLGALAIADPAFAAIEALAQRIAAASGCQLGYLPTGVQAMGAYVAGALPHRGPGAVSLQQPGLDASAMLTAPLRSYLLWNCDPELDSADPAGLRAALGRADLVIACSAFRTPALEATADLLLPIASFAETAGSFVNLAGDWQTFQGAVAPPGEARPGWKVLRVLGNYLELAGFEQSSARDIRDELAALCANLLPDNRPLGEFSRFETAAPIHGPAVTGTLTRIGPVPIYAIDMLTRYSPALQRTPLAEPLRATLHPEDAARLGLGAGDPVRLRQGESEARLESALDDAILPGTLRIPAGVSGDGWLGAQIGPVTVERA